MSAADDRWMVRALCLASLSLGRTWPNPGVGCVIVKDGRLIGQGRHETCGDAHAEVRALADCRRRGNDAAGAAAYVTLAPCTRQGRQPPCVNALIAARISRVVAAIADPAQDDPTPALRGVGVTYRVGVLAQEAEHIHGGFLHRVRTGLPRLTGKWAMTADGFIAASTGAASWISSSAALSASRRRRRAFDAIVIGAGTARRDDPQLLALRARMHGSVPGPLRVVVSQTAELKPTSRLVASIPHAPLLVIHGEGVTERRRGELRRLGATVKAVGDAHDPRLVARALADLGCNDVLVEGGSTLHGAWLRAGLFQRLEIYIGLKTLGGGMGVAAGEGAASIGFSQGWIAETPPAMLDGTLRLRLKRE
ncbi:MAG: bifunctional diaminohydroxyphosphoribosylaminopyrimidine deaminase/5-amino-6-(5-phosphoribosylamino)uracil reductase RibD [Planctomycetes bacterium]|nr:bifunctional diaminohydroxyphosphoribosylaminopyrimidine deaminase/5-amino-6-(5-phosphoribosylamino)uracil reductase RibD [Planctomycetota bacterium]